MIFNISFILVVILLAVGIYGVIDTQASVLENQKRMHGGSYSPPVEFFANTTFLKLNGQAIRCSGVLIDPQFVLTSASCIYDEQQTAQRRGESVPL